MASNERATVAVLDAARLIFKSHIESSQGRVIDMAGDSVLASFRTATGAVAAALAVQAELNAKAQAMPEDARVRYRIGIHLGDVIEKADGSVYGDGVNIAARLQSMADHGGVTVSGMVHEAVRNRLTATFEDQGDQQVKNIPHPVRAYRIQVDGSVRGESTAPTVGIDALLDQREQLKELLKQKFKRRLTVVFTDLKGSTEIAEREGDLSSRAMLKRYHDLVQEAIKQNGGVFVKTIGDGTLSHFAEAQSALRAACRAAKTGRNQSSKGRRCCSSASACIPVTATSRRGYFQRYREYRVASGRIGECGRDPDSEDTYGHLPTRARSIAAKG
jgi:class 3 adenylate cyclase